MQKNALRWHVNKLKMNWANAAKIVIFDIRRWKILVEIDDATQEKQDQTEYQNKFTLPVLKRRTLNTLKCWNSDVAYS